MTLRISKTVSYFYAGEPALFIIPSFGLVREGTREHVPLYNCNGFVCFYIDIYINNIVLFCSWN